MKLNKETTKMQMVGITLFSRNLNGFMIVGCKRGKGSIFCSNKCCFYEPRIEWDEDASCYIGCQNRKEDKIGRMLPGVNCPIMDSGTAPALIRSKI